MQADFFNNGKSKSNSKRTGMVLFGNMLVHTAQDHVLPASRRTGTVIQGPEGFSVEELSSFGELSSLMEHKYIGSKVTNLV